MFGPFKVIGSGGGALAVYEKFTHMTPADGVALQNSMDIVVGVTLHVGTTIATAMLTLMASSGH